MSPPRWKLRSSPLPFHLSGADEATRFVANLLAGFAAMTQGDSAEGSRLIEPALEWGSAAEASLHVFQASMAAFWLGDDDRIEALLNRTETMARERGEVGMLVEDHGIRSGHLVVAQRYDQLVQTATEAVQLAREIGAINLELLPRACLAIVSAIRGRDDEARRQAEDVFERGNGRGLPVPLATATWALGLVDLGRGRWEEALARLTSLADHASGVADSYVATLAAADRVEAGVRANRPAQAMAALTMFESWATDTQAAAAQPRVASCRALLANGKDADQHFEQALQLRAHARPFDSARIRLLYGEHLRRERRRVDARIHLRAAVEGFERLQAEPWAERARAELRATGETAHKRDPSTLSQLTAQELQIASYVAEGLTNKQIAAYMFLSKRTIDYHLRNVFTKLGSPLARSLPDSGCLTTRC